MITLKDTSESIRAYSDALSTTSDLTFLVNYADIAISSSGSKVNSNFGAFSGTTPEILVPAPDLTSFVRRDIKHIEVRNNDTQSHLVNVEVFNGIAVPIYKGILPAGYTFLYIDGDIKIINDQGGVLIESIFGMQGEIGYGVYAFGVWNGSGGRLDSVGIQATRVGAGTYDLVFDSSLPNANYSVHVQPYQTVTDTNAFVSARTQSGFRVVTGLGDNGTTADTPIDTDFSITVFTSATALGATGPLASVNGNAGPAVLLEAEDIPYDNIASGLSATNTQEALDEVLDIAIGNTRSLLITPTNGQTTFSLPDTPKRLDRFLFIVNGFTLAFGLDYTIGGSIVTYNNTNDVILEDTDNIELKYYY